MENTCKIGFITTFSGRWPQDLPKKRLLEYGEWCQKNLEGADIIGYDRIAGTNESVAEAIAQFRAAGVSAVIMLYGAFTGDDVPCAISDALRVPLILWAPYEPPFERDTRLWANALCSATMNSAALRRMGHESIVIYGDKNEANAGGRLKTLVRAMGAKARLRGMFLGLFGYRPTAFYNCAFDEGLIRKTFGVRMEGTELKVVFDRMEQLEASEVLSDMQSISERFDVSQLPEGHLENHSKLYLAMKAIVAETGYDYSTIKCWPEMGNLHTQPCAVLARLADEGINVVCEGDVDVGLASMAQNILTGLPTFVTDMININEAENTLTYWHCGNAALSLMDSGSEVQLRNHPLVGQGTAFYGSLKSGPVTVARFCNLGGVYKLFLLPGEAISTERVTKGVMVNVRVAPPVRDILESITREGVPHHYSIVWADVQEELLALAQLLNVEVIKL